jgi:hypothetical protein
MAMEDVSLTEISHGVARLPAEERKKAIYINLQLEFWLMLWEIRAIPVQTLRGYAEDLFLTEPGRGYWNDIGSARVSLKTGARREQLFLRIVNEEYLKAVASIKPHDAVVSIKSRSARDFLRSSTALGVIAAVAGGLAIRGIIRRNRNY